ncbi:hypothetical protein FRB94_009603 [Tulasnella sp. JGI-2019a]|nr:hypothetical protein FRB94_009603 [Tulasnella sp. JGI-2019a]KAG8996829.1 hypothetical protein FRB93_000641 [Tulasnella sp. JGI-2019a]
MFRAKTTKSASEVLVKFVVGEYGETVHRVLADRGFAPTLYATKRVEGAPTAIVMEFLQPLSTGGSSGWSTLYDLAKYEDMEPYEEIIQEELNRLLDVLRENKMVHGDLRPNNVMLKVDDDGELWTGDGWLKVIDFDWSGMDGDVHYNPMQRNDSIPWPAARLEPIVMDCDHQQIDMLLKDIF